MWLLLFSPFSLFLRSLRSHSVFSGDFDKQSTHKTMNLLLHWNCFNISFLRGHTLSVRVCVSLSLSHYLRLFSFFRTVCNRIYISTYAECCCFLPSVFNILNLSENGFFILRNDLLFEIYLFSLFASFSIPQGMFASFYALRTLYDSKQ